MRIQDGRNGVVSSRWQVALMFGKPYARNPLIWMAEVNGLLVDLRDMPREVQAIAFERGMIPYIPADQD